MLATLDGPRSSLIDASSCVQMTPVYEKEINIKVVIYPNPTIDYLLVRLLGNIKSVGKIVVIDLFGRKVFTKEVNGSNSIKDKQTFYYLGSHE